MESIYMGRFNGLNGNSNYGSYNVYFNYNSNGTTLTDMSISFTDATGNGRYTTNSMWLADVSVAGQKPGFDSSKQKGYVNGGKVYNWSRSIYGSINAGGTSAYIWVRIYRSGNTYTDLDCTVTGLATPPTGVWCSASAASETSINLSGGYSSNGGAGVTGTQFQYHTVGGSWTNCGSSLTGLSANTTYYFRVGYTNAAGTSWSGETSATTYDYPKPTSLNDVTIGGAITTEIYNPLKRAITIGFYDSGGTLLFSRTSSANGSHRYTPTTAEYDKFYARIPNDKRGSYYVKVTYGSSNKTYGNRTYSIKNTENPVFDSSYIINVVNTKHTDIAGSSKFISGHNTLSGSIKPMIPQKSANGSKYSLSTSGQTQEKTFSTSNIPFTFNDITNNTLSITAQDSRGLTKQASVTLDIVAYNKPSVSSYTLVRQNGTGTHAIWNVTGVYTNWTGLTKSNTIKKVEWRWKPNTTSGTWSSWADITSSLATNANGVWKVSIIPSQTFNNTSEFLLQLRVTDMLETVEMSEMTLSTANAFIWKDLANKRVGINKKPTEALDVAGNIKGSGNVEAPNIKGNALYINGVKMLWYE